MIPTKIDPAPIELRVWAVVSSIVNPYTPPELCGVSIEGAAYGHPRFEDGERIRTGRIVRVEGRNVWTESTQYRLVGAPHGKYAEWCAERGIAIDENAPIKIRPASDPCPPPFNPWNDEVQS